METLSDRRRGKRKTLARFLDRRASVLLKLELVIKK
jgi:hypothetical protein